jgi:hypothetical protein
MLAVCKHFLPVRMWAAVYRARGVLQVHLKGDGTVWMSHATQVAWVMDTVTTPQHNGDGSSWFMAVALRL